MVLRWSPTRIQGSLTSTIHCRVRQGSDIQAFLVGSGSPSRAILIPVPPGPGHADPACLVPELDFFHLINSNWAAQRAIRLRYLCGPPGLAGY